MALHNPTHWPPKLNAKERKIREALGIHARDDGWYGRIGPKVRYICKRASLSVAARAHAVAVKRWG